MNVQINRNSYNAGSKENRQNATILRQIDLEKCLSIDTISNEGANGLYSKWPP